MNIYIANLSYGVKDADLQELFEKYGEVSSSKVVTDRESGRSRGFGFVEMPDDDDAQRAIEGLNNMEFNGRAMVVNVAKPKTERRDFNRRDDGYNSR